VGAPNAGAEEWARHQGSLLKSMGWAASGSKAGVWFYDGKAVRGLP
jgi:hypothetical protein